MRYTIKIQMNNAAFETGKALEVQAILDQVTRRLNDGLYEGKLLDTNGNVVGSAKVTRT